jgi:hypothetical protein
MTTMQHRAAFQRRLNRIFGVRKRKDFGGYRPVGKSADPSETVGSFANDLPAPDDASFRETLDDEAQRRDDMTNGGDDDNNGDDNAPPMFSPGPRHISELADLLSEASGRQFTRQQALDYLLHTAGGRKMVIRSARLHKRKTNMPTQLREELLSAFTKRHGIHLVAKCINVNGPYMTETEFTQQIKEDCARTGREFSKVFAEPEVGQAWRATRDAAWIKQGTGTFAGMQLQPILPRFTHEPNINNPKTALRQLYDLADEMKRKAPTLSDAQAFARVVEARPELAARERAEARAKLPTIGGKFVGE